MSYIDEKEKLMKQKKEVLEKYKDLFLEVMKLSDNIKNLEKEVIYESQAVDIFQLYTADNEMKKLMRLIFSLMYVENPDNSEIFLALKGNMEINHKNIKR